MNESVSVMKKEEFPLKELLIHTIVAYMALIKLTTSLADYAKLRWRAVRSLYTGIHV